MAKKRYILYQLNKKTDYRFSRWGDETKDKFNLDHYSEVYSGDIDISSSTMSALEQLFTKFNIDFPDDYVGRSMSISDVVEIKDQFKSTFYYVDISFKDITEFVRR